MVDEKIEEILGAAIRAPSGDNCQPWWFEKVGNSSIKVGMSPELAKSFFDFNYTGTYLSLGCVLENICLKAAHRQLSANIQNIGSPIKPVFLVEFSDQPDLSVSELTIQAMYQRTVNRRPFRTKPVDSELKSKVLSNPVDSTYVNWFDSRQDISKWAYLIYLADRIRYSHPVIHEEVFSKILLSKKEADEKRIGLEIDRLGIGPMASLVIRFLRPWERMTKLAKIGVDRLLSKQSQFMGIMSGGMVLVGASENTMESWVQAGRQVQRLWIQAQECGLCVHPMTVALYLNSRYKEEGSKSFLPAHIPILDEIEGKLTHLLPNQYGMMLFRIGYGPMMKVPAIRKPLNEFIREE